MPFDAKKYRDHSELQYNLGLELLEELKPEETDTILDVGCGDGRLSIEIAKKVPSGNVIGIDNLESMVKLAKETAAQNFLSNISFTCIDAQDIDFSAHFERIFSNCAIHWFTDQKLLFSKLFHALKPGGRIVFTGTYNAPKGKIWDLKLEILTNLVMREKYRTYLTSAPTHQAAGFKPVNTVKRMLERSGFRNITFNLKDSVLQFADLNAYLGFEYMVWATPSLSVIPPAVRDELITEMNNSYLEQFQAIPEDRLSEALTISLFNFIMTAEKPTVS